jgi:hypothetical protein
MTQGNRPGLAARAARVGMKALRGARFRASAFGLALMAILVAGAAQAAVRIENVSHAPSAFDPAAGESLAVSFRLSEVASVELQILDSRRVQIRSIRSVGPLEAGDHELVWDGRDDGDRAIPADAYAYRLRAIGAGGEAQLWDLFDSSGGETLALNPEWDGHQGWVRYVLPAAARVVLRAGLDDGGPLLQTIANWPVRAEGEQVEAWDGRDETGFFDLRAHPKRKLTLLAYTLPLNAVVVGRPGASVPRWPGRTSSAGPRAVRDRRRPVPGLRRADLLGDCRLTLAPVEPVPRGSQGALIAREPLALRIDVTAADRQRMLAERFEVAVFVDGVLVFENEVGFLPAVWTWNPRGANPGRHTITANLWGYEGSMGTGSVVAIAVPDPQSGG